MTNVKTLISEAFKQASADCQKTFRSWVTISHIVGGQLPDSRLVFSLQHIGEIDILLRCMEQESLTELSQQLSNKNVDFGIHFQVMLSEFWICQSYEVFRLMKAKKLWSTDSTFENLAHELRLLRISIAKHEIANDRKLKEPLALYKLSAEGQVTDSYEYSLSDPRRSHIMGIGGSDRGSVMWDAIDGASGKSRWIERLSLSERILSVFQSNS